MKLFFDLSKQERWHRLEWEQCLERAAAAQSSVALAASRAEADFVITPATPQLDSPLSEIFGKMPADEFVWDYGDQPVGRHPGFYCSLRHRLFDASIHRSFCYPITFNEAVREFETGDATRLFSFVGGITSPLRRRLVDFLQTDAIGSRGLVKVQGGPWNAMFDRSGLAIKREFADSLRVARFVFCPRGNGVGSVRLFETMQAKRVPVIISDGYVLPAGIDWASCAIVVKERQLETLPNLLIAREADWERMAERARKAWEDHFSHASLFKEMAGHLTAISSAVRAGNRPYALPVLSTLAVFKAKSLYRKLQRSKKKTG